MNSIPRRVFISRVSRELDSYAEELRNALQSVEIAARTQLSFRQEPDTETTLEKLSKYIHDSDVVLCLQGNYTGAFPPDSAMDRPIHPAARIDRNEKTWRDLLPPGFDKISYTQWEFILSRYWQKTAFIIFASGHKPDSADPLPKIDDLPQQQRFLRYLTSDLGLDRSSFDHPDKLCRHALCSLWPDLDNDFELRTVLQRYETKIDSIQETQFHLLRTSLITLAALITLGLGGYLLIKKGQDAATVRDQVAAEKQKLLSAQINILIQDRAAIQKERDPDLPAITEEELLQQLAIRRNKPVDYIRTTLAAAIESSDNLLQAQGFLLAGKGKQAEDKADSVLAAEAFATQRIRQAYEVKAQVASNESRYQDALKNFQTAAALCDQTTEPLLWANVQNKIARALMLLDDFENAQNVAIDTIKYLEVKNFTDERIYADCLSNLGSITEGTSRFDEAEKYKKMAVEHGRSSYGENHPEYVNFLSNLGVYYLKREEFNDAKDLLLRSLEYNEASFGKESTVIISDLNNLGQFYQKTKNYRESEDLMNRCLGLIKSKLGINHVIYGATLGNLGTLYVEMNRLPEAERNLKNAITVLENKLGENHSLVAAGWGNLAIVFKQNKQYGDAESSLKKSIEIDERIFGANHPNLVVRYFNLSSIYAEIGQLNDAEDFARKSLILTMKFGYGTGKKKEGFNEIIEQYLKILLSRGLSFEDITSRVISIGPEAGWDAATWAKSMEPILQFVASQKK